jgi:hypothetical protein
MTLALPIATTEKPAYAVPEKALRRWVAERLRHSMRPDGATVYTFALTGSTCTNQPIAVLMTAVVAANGRIESTSASPASSDIGCDVMCASGGDGRKFLNHVGACDEAVGMTLDQAAFFPWNVEPSGCFCSAGNRLHKWRNVFQAIHFAARTFVNR